MRCDSKPSTGIQLSTNSCPWACPSGPDQSVPPSFVVLLRNSEKPPLRQEACPAILFTQRNHCSALNFYVMGPSPITRTNRALSRNFEWLPWKHTLDLEIMHRLLSWTLAATLPSFALLAICSTLCACQKPPRNRGEAVTQMVQLQDSGRYDDAVRVVQDWMSRHQNDTSQDDFLHLQIAMAYISKAYGRQSTRDESLRNSASHLERALNLYASKKP